MKERRQTFLERLTGTQIIAEDELEDEPLRYKTQLHSSGRIHQSNIEQKKSEEEDADDEDAGLPIDMYETDTELIIQSMIAGVTSENLHISISHDSVTISGKRIPHQHIPDSDYFERELYWGTFSREIILPFEIDTDGADAVEKYGLLIIRLPKINKNRPQVLKVRSIL